MAPKAKDVAIRLVILNLLYDHGTIFVDEPTAKEAERLHSEILELLDKYDLWNLLTASEHEIFKCNPLELSDEYATDIFYSINSRGVLAWCLGLLEGMPGFDTSLFDDESILDDFYETKPSPVDIATIKWKLRSAKEIDHARDVAEMWHWRSRTLSLQRSKPIAKSDKKSELYRKIVSDVASSSLPDLGVLTLDDDFSAFGKPYLMLDDEEWDKIHLITLYRHRALNWVCGYAPSDNYDETPTDT
ncbi:MAG: DUF4272 domain-containing protein [Cyanobacteria bacterium]|nr:DUF4272 domain-containing protein [Cyanobacteriota bacterium]